MPKITKIEVSFPVPVELPDGWERTLDALVGMVCEFYQSNNPDRVMWPAGHGAKPIWQEPNEPDFDSSIFTIDCAEREDYHGENPYNPNAEQLKALAREAWQQRKRARGEENG